MRLQGTLFEWNDELGFGYMKPNGQAGKVYVDLQAFNYRPHKPSVGDILIVEVEQQGEQLRALNAKAKLGRVAPPPVQTVNPTKVLLAVLVILLLMVSAIEFLPSDAFRS